MSAPQVGPGHQHAFARAGVTSSPSTVTSSITSDAPVKPRSGAALRSRPVATRPREPPTARRLSAFFFPRGLPLPAQTDDQSEGATRRDTSTGQSRAGSWLWVPPPKRSEPMAAARAADQSGRSMRLRGDAECHGECGCGFPGGVRGSLGLAVQVAPGGIRKAQEASGCPRGACGPGPGTGHPLPGATCSQWGRSPAALLEASIPKRGGASAPHPPVRISGL